MGQSNSYTVVAIMKQIFSEQGILRVVRSDNGPHFNGQAFQSLTKGLGAPERVLENDDAEIYSHFAIQIPEVGA